MRHALAPGMQLVVASHNAGKVWEIKQLIAQFGLEAVSAGELGLPEPEETEKTFQGNARLKAVAAAEASGLPALADDSGLAVACLGGAPGIYSARWAGPQKDFAVAMRKVAEEVEHRHGWTAPGPRANFVCALCLAWPDGEAEFFEGRVDGVLVWPIRGGRGFGYDPMFQPDGEDETFGEMEPARKHAMSHRARAFEAFRAEKLVGLASIGKKAIPAGAGAGAYEGLAAAAANLSTADELVTFIADLRGDLKDNAHAWDNAAVDNYLEAIGAFIEDSPNLEVEPRWRLVAKALLAGSRRT